MKVRLLSTKNGLKSGSLKRIAEALGTTLGYKVWRSTKMKEKRKHFRYGDAADKLTQYKYFQQQGLSALEFTTDPKQAFKWWDEGFTVFGRKLLNASCGDGIVVFDKEDGGVFHEASPCPVYTKYKPKKREFRVHIFKDSVVAIVEKRKKKDWQGESNSKIRNLANGYVFCQEVELSDAMRQRIVDISLAARKVCQSDFAGVDLGYNEKHDDLFIIEVNSAPGIEGSNVNAYVNTMVKYV